jgi:hypothetical protein
MGDLQKVLRNVLLWQPLMLSIENGKGLSERMQLAAFKLSSGALELDGCFSAATILECLVS